MFLFPLGLSSRGSPFLKHCVWNRNPLMFIREKRSLCIWLCHTILFICVKQHSTCRLVSVPTQLLPSGGSLSCTFRCTIYISSPLNWLFFFKQYLHPVKLTLNSNSVLHCTYLTHLQTYKIISALSSTTQTVHAKNTKPYPWYGDYFSLSFKDCKIILTY